MPALASQRCLNHPAREAAARCPECGRFFCRECVAEHDDRVICAGCLRKLARGGADAQRWKLNLWPIVHGAGGLCVAWFVFYVIGRMFLSVPSDFHAEKLWKMGWLDSMGTKDE